MKRFIDNLLFVLRFLFDLFTKRQEEETLEEKIVKSKTYVVNSHGFRALLLDHGFDLVQSPFPGKNLLSGLECYARIHKTKGNQFFFIGYGKHYYLKEGSKPGLIKYIRLYPVIDQKQFIRVIEDFIPVRDWIEIS